jgi:hypothetical protein
MPAGFAAADVQHVGGELGEIEKGIERVRIIEIKTDPETHCFRIKKTFH